MSAETNTYFIYILECSNGHYYTGYTTDIERRYKEHQAGSTKCKYTRSFPPERIAACWKTDDVSLALKVEKEIKKLSKQEKIRMIKKPEALLKMLQTKKPGEVNMERIEIDG